jgi:hypothetical protein
MLWSNPAMSVEWPWTQQAGKRNAIMASANSIKLVISFMISAKLGGGVSMLSEGGEELYVHITYFGDTKLLVFATKAGGGCGRVLAMARRDGIRNT